MQKVDENETFIGIDGMRHHLEAVKKRIQTTQWRLLGNLRTVKLLFQTNKVIEMTGVDIDKIVNGKIVEHGGAVNTFDAFGENGLIKPV